jgi:predicted nucleotidyltransferase
MPSVITDLIGKDLIRPPSFLKFGVHYEVLMGSVAYGVSGESSDWDVYGFCLPPKDTIFPHLRGEIQGFGKQTQRFEQYQQHHVNDPSNGRSYDFSIYSIIKYFQLCMENNPNMIDSLFVPQRCVLHCTQLGNLVRENRRMFLHRGCWHKFKGYAFSQLHKMRTKNPEEGSKRAKNVEEFGFDVKFAYHVVRLLAEVEQILAEGDLDLERNREQLKAIRRGEVGEREINDYFTTKEKALEELYNKSTLPYAPDEEAIKKLLLQCLEMHYGSLQGAYEHPDRPLQLLRDIQSLLDQHRDLLR